MKTRWKTKALDQNVFGGSDADAGLLGDVSSLDTLEMILKIMKRLVVVLQGGGGGGGG